MSTSQAAAPVASAPSARPNAPAKKKASSAAPPRLPAPSSPQAPIPFLAAASGASSSTLSVGVLAVLLALVVIATPRGTRVLQPLAMLVHPPAVALAQKRPG